MGNAAAQYLQKVNKLILCPGSLKRPFLRQLKNEIQFYCADHSGADMTMLSKRFGSPEDIAETFLQELGEQTVSRCLRTRKKLLLLTLGVVLTTAAFVGIISLRINSLQQKLPDKDFLASIIYDEENKQGISLFPSQDTIFGNNKSIKPSQAE